jgi:hypothetical protein
MKGRQINGHCCIGRVLCTVNANSAVLAHAVGEKDIKKLRRENGEDCKGTVQPTTLTKFKLATGTISEQ